MHTPFIDLKECRVQQARAFAWQFNKFEWKDLCSYQGFLTLMDHGLDTGDFFPALTLAKGRLRKQTRTTHIGMPNYSPRDINNY
jgi:hypothetical protein